MFQLLFLLLYCIYLSEIQFRFCSCFCIILNVDSNIKLCLLIFSCVFSFYYTGLKVKVTQSCPTLCRPMDNSLPGSSVCGILQARIYWSGQPFSSPGNLPNPRIKHCRQIPYCLKKGSPRILEWIAYPFSRGSSPPRDRIGVSCIAGRFFTI